MIQAKHRKKNHIKQRNSFCGLVFHVYCKKELLSKFIANPFTFYL